MSYVAHMNEWVPYRTYERVRASYVTQLMSHIWWVSARLHVTHVSRWMFLFAVNESCHTYEWGSTRECVAGTYQRQNKEAEVRWLPCERVSTRSVLQSRYVAVCCRVLQCVAATLHEGPEKRWLVWHFVSTSFQEFWLDKMSLRHNILVWWKMTCQFQVYLRFDTHQTIVVGSHVGQIFEY